MVMVVVATMFFITVCMASLLRCFAINRICHILGMFGYDTVKSEAEIQLHVHHVVVLFLQGAVRDVGILGVDLDVLAEEIVQASLVGNACVGTAACVGIVIIAGLGIKLLLEQGGYHEGIDTFGLVASRGERAVLGVVDILIGGLEGIARGMDILRAHCPVVGLILRGEGVAALLQLSDA